MLAFGPGILSPFERAELNTELFNVALFGFVS
ncbi:unknown [Prevotella sp. CAG:1092]|nr:unknown [Prevotella sp. CAG:1092]